MKKLEFQVDIYTPAGQYVLTKYHSSQTEAQREKDSMRILGYAARIKERWY